MFGDLCTRCKGRLWCGLSKCPILESVKNYIPRIKIFSSSIFGVSPPSIFVGHCGYPNVFAGPLIGEDERKMFTSTAELYGKSLEEILGRTSVLIRTARRINIRKMRGKIIETSQEIAMSEKSVDTEVLVDKVYQIPQIDQFFHPTGPRIEPRRIDIVDNPAIPHKVDMVVEEKLKAERALRELYRYGYNVDYLQRLLSSGVLGRDRKLVPTRWSITAVDDILSRAILERVKYMQEMSEILYFFNSFMGNEFHILLLPGSWEYEMIESWMRGSLYSPSSVIIGEDYEPFNGRKDYASNITGAYYAARLGVAEYLNRIGRQARVIVYREITSEYKIPLGVWVIRETVRKAFNSSPTKFDSIDEAVNHVKAKTRVKEWTSKSRIIYMLKHQKRIEDFML